LVTEIKVFRTPGELINVLDNEIERIKTLLEQYMGMLDEQKAKIEKLQRLSESLGKLFGKTPTLVASQEVDVMGLKFVVNPSPHQEVETLEEIVKNLNDKLIVLQKIKKAVESLGMTMDAELNLTVSIVNDIPTRIMLKLT